MYNPQAFIHRHLGSSDQDQQAMLATLGLSSMEELMNQTVPSDIYRKEPLDLPAGMTENDALDKIKAMADKNANMKSFIGLGYYPTFLPAVIQRNVLENPGWYTAYTPYQAEVAQGRLEALLNYQQMIIDLTGLELANASLLDEATAAAEAMAMAHRVSKSKSNLFFVDDRVYPQTIEVLKTRAHYFDIELVIGKLSELSQGDYFGALYQYPGEAGDVVDLTPYIQAAKTKGTINIVAADIMALVLLKSPAEMGADIALGNSQRFGVPMGYGGPHAAYFAFRDEMKRSAPGRIIGVTIDAKGNPALRMALQTREQHIRREKATSNICTAQVLLANMVGMYAVYHGPEGVRRIAERIHRLAGIFARAVKQAGGKIRFEPFFDTVQVELGYQTEDVYQAAVKAGYNLRKVSDDILGVAFHEQASEDDLVQLIKLFTGQNVDVTSLDKSVEETLDSGIRRQHPILTHPVFNSYHTEHEMLRYLKRLENKDLAMNHSMISLGSCTMKLNATSEMIPITWPAFTEPHPFAPREQVAGYLELVDSLCKQLEVITGFDAICMQPNSGASGEYAGMLTIKRYLDSKGEHTRNVCLIPRSAHGTNPASAQMMGMEIIIVNCDEHGNVDVADLKAKAEQNKATLAALMITYPSTHGVFEESICEICDIIHQNGGQVYMDGANMNAQVALMRPADIGADVLHVNLHKTFAIPHGGGGPGMGPIGMKSHLAPFMPGHIALPEKGMGAVSAAQYGSASILPIPWMYITMMGHDGLRQATQLALLNANYIATRLSPYFPILYTGNKGRVAHECIVDLRPLKKASGIAEVDIAKRLMDYGFHAPTMSFPVAGTLMVEPTESESKAELDRFIDALIAIRAEIDKVEKGIWPAEDNPLKNAPHTQGDLIEEWKHPYTREEATFPLAYLKENKFWPTVKRVDDVYGDRHLVCTCPSTETYG